MTAVDKGAALRPVRRWRAEAAPCSAAPRSKALPAGPAMDQVAVEEPLEIRVAGETVAITMRTPGEDQRLVLGFLFAEGVIRSADDVGTVAHCGRPGTEGFGNVIDVAPGPGVSLDVDWRAARRGTITTAACGVCGRRTIADLLERCPRLAQAADARPVPVSLLCQAVARLREVQGVFHRTGGTHAVAVFAADGELLAGSEDIGRHNAADKVVGALLLKHLVGAGARAGPAPCVMAISGRSSFEMVQKAAMAGVPIVSSVSAPSTLAIALAEAAGLTLAGFVREGALNLYTHPERVGLGSRSAKRRGDG